MQNKTICATCYKCADIMIYVVSVTLCAILKIHNSMNLLNVTIVIYLLTSTAYNRQCLPETGRNIGQSILNTQK